MLKPWTTRHLIKALVKYANIEPKRTVRFIIGTDDGKHVKAHEHSADGKVPFTVNFGPIVIRPDLTSKEIQSLAESATETIRQSWLVSRAFA